MRNTKIVPATREELLEAIRGAAAGMEGGPGCLTLQKFTDASGIHRGSVCKHFPNWGTAVEAAGIHLERYNKPIDDGTLLADWGAVVRKLKRLPPATSYRFHGRYSPSTFEKRFHKWSNIARAFRGWAQGKPEWEDVMEVLAAVAPGERGRMMRPWSKCNSRLTREELEREAVAIPRDDRPIYGEPVDFPGLTHAPTTEAGVLYVFGLVAARLGFRVRGVQQGFPDCDALRRVGAAQWQPVRIEFEFQSGNFLLHKHAVEGCDIIVCWEHNWADCPAGLEVIALSEKLDLLRSGAGEQVPGS